MAATTAMTSHICPAFPNQDQFQGSLIHPQFWDESMDYTNKKVIVIGSGATAVTLVPAIAEKGSACNYVTKIS